jgi:hypothetical protein
MVRVHSEMLAVQILRAARRAAAMAAMQLIRAQLRPSRSRRDRAAGRTMLALVEPGAQAGAAVVVVVGAHRKTAQTPALVALVARAIFVGWCGNGTLRNYQRQYC